MVSDKVFHLFCKENEEWLDDYSLFVALKEHFKGLSWYEWPENIRQRQKKDLETIAQELQHIILREKFFQFLFYSQWFDLKKYCNQNGIKIIGDIPFYVQHDSADVWANRELFKLDEKGNRLFVAGVPPDYFSETGQLWGNPVYKWDVLQSTRYDWWKKRLKQVQM